MRTNAWRYGLAIAVIGVTLAVRLAFNRFFGNKGEMLFFVAAVMISAWYGGLGPGLLSTAVAAFLIDLFLFSPAGTISFTPDDQLRLLIFLTVGTLISWLCGRLHASQAYLEERVRQRTAELNFRRSLLESQSQASLDGILAVDRQQQVIFHNRRFVELWELANEPLSSDQAALAQRMSQRLPEHSDPFLQSHRQLTLKSGRCLACYSAEILSGEGESFGHVWFFRDVTEEHRLERQVLEVCEREQRRIGEDLHDGLGQHLTGISLMCKGLEQKLASKAPRESAEAARIAQLVAESIGQTRQLSRGLRPIALALEGLCGALNQLAVATQETSGIVCRFNGPANPPKCDPGVEIHLFRIAQEAVNNAVKHAQPSEIDILLTDSPEAGLILRIEDDGIGFDPQVAGSGMGLHIMRHRASVIGAALEFHPSDEGRGTVIVCTLRPVERRAAGDAASSGGPTADPEPASIPNLRQPGAFPARAAG